MKFNGSAGDNSTTDLAWISSYWGLFQRSGVGGLLFRCSAIQFAGLIEFPCAIPSKGACAAGGGVGLAGVNVGVVELFLSVIDGTLEDLEWNSI